MKHLILAAAAAAALTGAAYAQTATDDATTAPAAPDDATTMEPAADGVTAVDTDTVEMTFVTPTEADFLATRLMGTNVQNAEGESIGEIDDLIIRDGSELTGVVLSVGGFLGIGERHVVVDPKTITITADGDSWAATANTTREALEQAPEFEYEGDVAQ